ncbi:MAG: hypothetical protein KAJ32_09035, partial [Gammaproteobacteria bacterium]|nr:hypothetical protein [Gammaproteobacteria bacterium]
GRAEQGSECQHFDFSVHVHEFTPCLIDSHLYRSRELLNLNQGELSGLLCLSLLPNTSWLPVYMHMPYQQ